MELLVVEKHDGCGVFPLFTKGTAVNDLEANNEYSMHAEAIWGKDSVSHWLSCTINGYNTYIPDLYVSGGVLARDYNPTEIVVEKGQFLTLIALVFEWAYVRDENGEKGWLPVNKIISK